MGEMKKSALLLLLPFLCACSTAHKWTKTDKILETSYLVLHTVDWLQTRNADWDRFYERNPILGKKPSTSEVDLYFLLTVLLHPLVTHIIPQKYRLYWLIPTIGMQVIVVGNNFRIGMGINF